MHNIILVNSNAGSFQRTHTKFQENLKGLAAKISNLKAGTPKIFTSTSENPKAIALSLAEMLGTVACVDPRLFSYPYNKAALYECIVTEIKSVQPLLVVTHAVYFKDLLPYFMAKENFEKLRNRERILRQGVYLIDRKDRVIHSL